MYRPTSKASERPGTTPPSVAALISSSDASQDFIFCSKDSLVAEGDSASDASSSLVLKRGWTAVLVTTFPVAGDEKA